MIPLLISPNRDLGSASTRQAPNRRVVAGGLTMGTDQTLHRESKDGMLNFDKGWRMIRRWPMLALGTALLAGCVSPYYPVYPNYPTPLYVMPLPYVSQPVVQTPLPAPVPLLPAPERIPEALPELAPAPDASMAAPEPEAEPPPDTAAPATAAPESAAPAPPAPPAAQAGRGDDAPLQGFRPMRGQTRPGI